MIYIILTCVLGPEPDGIHMDSAAFAFAVENFAYPGTDTKIYLLIAVIRNSKANYSSRNESGKRIGEMNPRSGGLQLDLHSYSST